MQNQIVNLVRQLLKSTFQHIHDLLKVRMAAQIVADNFAIEQIKNWRQVEFLVVYLELRNIRNPFTIWFVCFEVPFQQIWSHFANLTFVRIVFSSFTNMADQAQLFHKLLYRLVIDTNIVVMQFLCDSTVAVTLFVLVEDCNDLRFHHLVLRWLMRLTQIVVERAARKPGKLQQCFQRIFLP